MAQSVDEQGRPLFLRGPRQASKNFGLDQTTFGGSPTGSTAAVPRPKFLFAVRFIRNVGEGGEAWKDGLTIAVKKVDRPTVSPVVQELTQYNKKRLIQTGAKYGNVNIDFHDTVDSVVSSMWYEYSSYYFGDTRHETDSDWNYDIVSGNNGFLNGGQGFGLTIPNSPNEASALSASFFFKKIECYQLFGGKFVQFDLIHPKITSFNPDEMDYENPNGSSIRMTLEYETIIYHNKSIPKDLKQDSEVLGRLTQAGMDGDVMALDSPNPGVYSNVPSTSYGNTSTSFENSPMLQNQMFGTSGLLSQPMDQFGNIINPINQAISTGGGALGSLGSINFGTSIPGSGLIDNIIGGEMATLGRSMNVDVGSSAMNYFTNPGKTINGAKFDVAMGVAGSIATNGVAQPGVAAAIMKGGVSNLLGNLNSNRSSTSQVGYRTVDTRDSRGFDPEDF